MKRYIKSDINSYSYTGHNFLDDSIVLTECNTDAVYITLQKDGKVCTVDAWGYADDDHEFYNEYPMSSIELAIADYNRLVTNWGDGTITSLSQVEAELNEWGKSLAEYGIKASTVTATTDNVANHVSTVTSATDSVDDIHHLIQVRKNAKKAAMRDGYDQVIIQSKEDGSYSFSRKYTGCCPDWYGDIIEEVNIVTENGKQVTQINEVLSSTDINCSDNVANHVKYAVDMGYEEYSKEVYDDGEYTIDKTWCVNGNDNTVPNTLVYDVCYHGDMIGQFNTLGEAKNLIKEETRVEAWTSGASMLAEAETDGWKTTQKSLFYDGETHTVTDYNKSTQGHTVSIETDYNSKLDEVEHWVCIDGERVEWFETTYDAIDYAETELFERG